MNANTASSVHWGFWAIGAVALIWNLLGCLNFLSQMNAEAVSGMPESYRAIVEGRPAWATGAFAIAVFGGAFASLLLLLRKSLAYHVYIVSLLGAIGAQMPFFGMPKFPAEALIGGLMQVIATALLIWYSKRAERRGWISRADRRGGSDSNSP
jgi:hypothetical protein